MEGGWGWDILVSCVIFARLCFKNSGGDILTWRTGPLETRGAALATVNLGPSLLVSRLCMTGCDRVRP
jgi:hypothetical protein